MSVPARILAAVLSAATPSVAQSFTSPRGLLGSEGDASHFALFNPGYERFMQIDDSWTGQPTSGIRAIAFRRDGDRVSPYATARTLDLTVWMGLCDYAGATGVFATNWATPPTTVFTTKPVNVPDWTALAASRPAPFDLALPFDLTWSYDGTRALAFELVQQNVTGLGSPDVDAERGAPLAFTQAVGTTFDFGCLVGGHFVEMSHALYLENYGANHPLHGIRLGVALSYAPPRQPAVVNLDLVDPDLAIPGLCARLHARPTLSLPLGATSTAGAVPLTWFDVPYAPALEGVRLFTQTLALDPGRPGLPAAVSDRRDAVVPDAPRPAPRCAYLYAPTASTPTATLWRDRGVVVRLQR